MQAGKTKAERKASRAVRNIDRNFIFGQLAADRALNRAIKKEVAIARESIKKTAASPAAIALTKAAYKEQCLAFETSKKETEDVSSNG
jgi:hypothetical protein